MEDPSRQQPDVRVLFAVDNTNLRRTLQSLLQTESDLLDIGAAPISPAAMVLAESRQADVVVLGVRMPASREIELIRDLSDLGVALGLVTVSLKRESSFAASLQALGANECVWTHRAYRDFAPAIRRAAAERSSASRLSVGLH